MKKLFIVNLKTYRESTGVSAEKLAEKFKDYDVFIAVQNADLFRVSRVMKNVFAQHVDPILYGANTGKDLAECLKENGAKGVLINHAEDRCDIEIIKKCIDVCKRVGLISTVCAENPELAEKIAAFLPDYIAIEPPELIGTLVSVSKVKPEVITETIRRVNAINDIPVLCGAGIADGNDVKKAMELGCSGIILATAVVKAENPEEKLEELLSGF
ncbi:MAG: triose-phosphate isomerase [Candidatus Aenigmatarchaeota archaeon]